MAELITTTKNKTYKYIRSLLQKKYRTEYKRYTVEGIKSVRDAMEAAAPVELIAVAESYDTSELVKDIPYVTICDDIFPGICDTKTPQGIIAVIKMSDNTHYSCDRDKLYIYCDGVSDPGNIGTIIRTADAAGFGGVLLSDGCADLYSPKTVRSSMGSFFNVDTVAGFTYERLAQLKETGFALYCGALSDDSIDYREPDYSAPSVLIVGNEANGVSNEILGISTHIIIPIYGKAESLNAAVAASIMMYEAGERRHG